MRIPDYIATAQSNLLRTKARTVLTIFAFVVGTFTLAMTTAFSQGLKLDIATQLSADGQPPNMITVTLPQTTQTSSTSGVPYYVSGRQVSGNSSGPSTYKLTSQDLAKVRSTPGIKAAYPAYGQLSVEYLQSGTQPKYAVGNAVSSFPGVTWALDAGSFPSNQQTNGIVLPYTYVEALGAGTASDLIGKTATIYVTNPTTQQGKSYTVTITGVMPDTQDVPPPVIAQPLADNIAQFEGMSPSQFSGIVAITDQTDPDAATLNKTASQLQNKGYSTYTYQDLLTSHSKILDIATYGMGGFACIAILAASIGIVNTLLMSVFERTQEIGLLKALGMQRRGITFIFLAEAISIGFWGGIFGVVGAALVGTVANPILGRGLFKGVTTAHILSYPLPYMAAIIGGAMIIGLLAGTIPAIRAGKLNPIDALRRE